jgi:hypothetical protein
MGAGRPPCRRLPLKWPYGRFRGGRLQGVEGSGLAGPSDTLGRPSPPLAMQGPWPRRVAPCRTVSYSIDTCMLCSPEDEDISVNSDRL